MRAMTEDEVRGILANAEDADRRLMSVPTAFFLLEWDHMDFVGWRDPKHPDRGYLLAETPAGPQAILLRASSATPRVRNGLCDLCHTMQPGDHVALFSARRAGDAGRRGDSVGAYICSDLSCHESVRLAAPLAPGEVRASVDRRIDETRRRVERFVAGVCGTNGN